MTQFSASCLHVFPRLDRRPRSGAFVRDVVTGVSCEALNSCREGADARAPIKRLQVVPSDARHDTALSGCTMSGPQSVGDAGYDCEGGECVGDEDNVGDWLEIGSRDEPGNDSIHDVERSDVGAGLAGEKLTNGCSPVWNGSGIREFRDMGNR